MWKKDCKEDEIFYEALCNQYFEQIYYYCKKLVRGQDQFTDFVEECTQNTFLEARKQISKLRKHPNIAGWLYTTARNLINHSYRSMYIKKKHEVILDDYVSYNNSPEFDYGLAEIFYNAIDVDKLVIEILKKLKNNEYELYTDYYKNNMSISSLSKKYGVSTTAMTTRIYRLKKKIKNIAHCLIEKQTE